MDKLLSQMYELASSHVNYSHLHSINILNDFQGFQKRCLKSFESEGIIVLQNSNWSLTQKGYEKAKNLYNEIKPA